MRRLTSYRPAEGAAMKPSPASTVSRPVKKSTRSPHRRQANRESRAAAGRALEGQRPPGRRDDRSRDRQPQTRPAGLAAPCGVEADERLWSS